MEYEIAQQIKNKNTYNLNFFIFQNLKILGFSRQFSNFGVGII